MLNEYGYEEFKEVYMTGIGQANDKIYLCENENEIDNEHKVQEIEEIQNDKDNSRNDNKNVYQINLSNVEKVVCLKEIIKRLKKVLYVYDKSMEPNSTYNYKLYCGGLLIYVSSSNLLFNGELVNIIVNLNAIVTNKFPKAQIKRIVFESVNYAKYLLSQYEVNQYIDDIEQRGV